MYAERSSIVMTSGGAGASLLACVRGIDRDGSSFWQFLGSSGLRGRLRNRLDRRGSQATPAQLVRSILTAIPLPVPLSSVNATGAPPQRLGGICVRLDRVTRPKHAPNSACTGDGTGGPMLAMRPTHHVSSASAIAA